MEVLSTMQGLGGLARRSQLYSLGVSRRAIDDALRGDVLFRVRPGWVGTSEASLLAIQAVLIGGRLTAHSALRTYGVWNGHDQRTHVQIKPNSCPRVQEPGTPLRRFVAPPFAPGGIVRHWAPFVEQSPQNAAWRVSLVDAFARFARIESDENIVATVESMLHTGAVSRAELPSLFARLPRRQRALRARLNGRGESGLETVVRMRLEDAGYRVQQQVQIGPDRVDIVIDEWLVVELDGDEFHDPATDRIRTNRLIRAGRRVLRFGHADVFHRWTEMRATIDEMLRAASIPRRAS